MFKSVACTATHTIMVLSDPHPFRSQPGEKNWVVIKPAYPSALRHEAIAYAHKAQILGISTKLAAMRDAKTVKLHLQTSTNFEGITLFPLPKTLDELVLEGNNQNPSFELEKLSELSEKVTHLGFRRVNLTTALPAGSFPHVRALYLDRSCSVEGLGKLLKQFPSLVTLHFEVEPGSITQSQHRILYQTILEMSQKDTGFCYTLNQNSFAPELKTVSLDTTPRKEVFWIDAFRGATSSDSEA